MMRPKDLRQGSGTKTFLDAMHGGKVHLARFILDALDGRIINSKTENSRTPLMFAVCLQDSGARAKFTRLLLEKGADVNCQDEDGRTALSHACELGHLDAVKLLVQFNADPDVSDAWGNSSLMYAASSGHGPVLEFLVRAFKRLGLKLDRTNNAGHSASQVAHFFGHKNCVQVLNVPSRRSVCTDDPPADGGEGESRLPNRLPRHILDRFSKQTNNDDTLPEVVHRPLRTGDGLWNRFKCPRSQSQDDGRRPSWAPPPQWEKSGVTEEERGVLFTSKQLQNCQLRDVRTNETLTSDPSRKDVRLPQQPADGFPLRGGAKSFGRELQSCRKQSYQGEMRDAGLSASRLKRASLQDDRFLGDKLDFLRTANKTPAGPKPLPPGKTPPLRSLKDSKARNEEGATLPGRRELKRASLVPNARPPKLLPGRGEAEPVKSPRGAEPVKSPRGAEPVKGPGSSPGLAALGTRLLRRFTAPEFVRMVMDCSAGSAGRRGRMSRSETFPLSHTHTHTHQQVDSQPSVDSISGVRCEFESGSSPSASD